MIATERMQEPEFHVLWREEAQRMRCRTPGCNCNKVGIGSVCCDTEALEIHERRDSVQLRCLICTRPVVEAMVQPNEMKEGDVQIYRGKALVKDAKLFLTMGRIRRPVRVFKDPESDAESEGDHGSAD